MLETCEECRQILGLPKQRLEPEELVVYGKILLLNFLKYFRIKYETEQHTTVICEIFQTRVVNVINKRLK